MAILLGGMIDCVEVGEMHEDFQNIPLGEAESVDLKLNMGAGELMLRGGTRDLFEGDFSYNVERWKPEIDYFVTDGLGRLRIRQGKSSGIPVGESKNRWNINVNDDVPLDIDVNFGAGEGTLDLRGLKLKSLDIEMGVGELTIDLSGKREQDLNVDIEGGIGSATLYLPRDIGVRVEIHGGIGSVSARAFNKNGKIYTNEAYGSSNILIDIEINAGIGSVELKMK